MNDIGDLLDIVLATEKYYSYIPFGWSTPPPYVDPTLVDVPIPNIVAREVNFDFNYSIYGFVEGIYDTFNNILVLAVDGTILPINIQSNNEVRLDYINTKVYVLSSNTWRKVIPIGYKMVKGYISGNINLKSCDNNDIILHCYRSDHFYIGSYKPNSDGFYEIPNLDCNDTYDIIMEDITKTIESKVVSKQIPKRY